MNKKHFMRPVCLFLITAMTLTGCGHAASAVGEDKEAVKEFIESLNDSRDSGKEEVVSASEKPNHELPPKEEREEWNKNARPAGRWDGVTKEEKVSGDGYEVVFSLQNVWEGGYTANVSIKNTGMTKITSWALSFDYPGDYSDCWNAEKEHTGNTYVFRNVDWNGEIAPGEQAEFGMNGTSDFEGFPGTYRLDKTEAAAGSTAAPSKTNAPEPSPQAGGSDPSGTTEPVSTEDEEDASDTVVSGTAKKHGRLRVKGKRIVDQKGKTFLIKGPSTHGIAWFPDYVNKSCFKSFKKWGANTIRLACYSSEGEGYNTGSVWKTIDKGVKAASSLGMYVIIDWHILNENNPSMTTKAAQKFFRHFASKYGKKKNIIWEICNEPHGCEWKKDIKPYAKKIIRLIRKYSKNLIVVGTPTWSQDVDVVAESPLTGKYKKNVCYTLHFYAGTHKDDLRNRVKTAIGKGLPILCTEFSICDASGDGALDKSSGKAWIKLLKKNRIGFIAWNISNKAEASSFFKPSVMRTGGFKKSDLTPAGKWVIKQWK